jgi:biotin carboxyl carrier protein
MKKFNIKVNGTAYEVEVEEVKSAAPAKAAAPKAAPAAAPVAAAPKAPAGAKVVEAPLPGTITKILVTPGQTIKSGEVVIKMEAMKMENDITSEFAGTVKAILVEQGGQVQSGQAMIELA